jgi:lipopolysaccharide transport system ATP-binding protein
MGTITVTNLGKAYRQYPSRWSRLAEWVIPGHKPRHTLKWVLQDINFTVAPGEAVGIIGINGAGKSTLLKMITGTTQPTTGGVSITGRVAALLELGMGFHPDFTGRQNVVMAGQLLGYTVDEIARLMPEIEAFAEIGDYIDQPVRVYSSGMQMRLAFSVATAQRPDVLIVDEALSVGDTYFQHKSFDRIRKFREQGTTLLLVSHDKQMIQSICDRAILLSAGQLAMEGEPEAVMDYYNALIADHKQQQIVICRKDDGGTATVSGTKDAEFLKVTMKNRSGEDSAAFFVGEPASVCVLVRVNKSIPNLVMGCGIKDRLGQMMFGTNTFNTKQILENPVPESVFEISVAFPMNLGPGTYSLHISLHSNDNHIGSNYDWRDRECVFEVINADKYPFVGSLWNPMEFKIGKKHDNQQ